MEGCAECPVLSCCPPTSQNTGWRRGYKKEVVQSQESAWGPVKFQTQDKGLSAYLTYQGEQGPPDWHTTPPTLNLSLPFPI